MPFSKKVKEEALVKSLRRCCVCRVFAGRYAAVHHIMPEAKRGSNRLANAIVLCQRCHGEAGHYNPQHPIGNKYSPDELLRHRDEWWDLCSRSAGWSVPDDPIGINPSSIALGGLDRVTFGHFTVSNRTTDPFWQVWIKLTLDSPVMDLEDLEVGIIERSPRVSRLKRVGDFSVEAVHIVTDDANGRRVRFLMIHQLRPSEYISYYVRVRTGSNSTDSLPLGLDLFDTGSGPLGLVFQDAKPAFRISFPVPLKGKFRIWCAGSYPLVDS